ncbi:MAG: PucR family transcriptional regulator ligand-binding domain-containing protein [Lachnospiraceae bacterium]|nr:PucR family transcriptional regulator ligand-binding domain-containing protein [Lachnospiraceae bacterium]
MSVTVRQLFKNADMLYNAKLVAGEKGLGNLVEWVHIVEDNEVGLFLHGQELVFTTGIADGSEQWIMKFIKNLHASNVSAFIVNLGLYIQTIPDELIEYCNEVNLPLYTIPWETRLIDMTRSFCQKIIENNNSESSVASGLKNILFGTEDTDSQIALLERHGYREDFFYNFLCISLETEYGTQIYFNEVEQIKKIAETLAKSMHELYVSFNYKEKIFITLVEYTEEERQYFLNEFFKLLSRHKLLSKIYIGVGESVQGLLKQKDNFECAYATNELAESRKERILEYRELGIEKIIFATDENVLKKYYNDTIGKLKKYDDENNTNLFVFLKEYLEEDASPQAVSEKMYIHRNTVNNYLKRIEKILEIESFNLEEKTKLVVAYRIADFIYKNN